MSPRSTLICSIILAMAYTVLIGCGGTPLTRVLKADAPGYKPKLPATNAAELGHHLIKNQPTTNACFSGDELREHLDSWSNRSLSYSSALDADLEADFGKTLQPQAELDRKAELTVVLRQVQVLQLSNLFYNPAAGCDLDINGRLETQVITRAIRADSIHMTQKGGGTLGVQVDTNIVHGQMEASTSSAAVWTGQSLYFGHRLEKVRVTSETRNEQIGTRQAIDLHKCSFVLDAIDDSVWNGTFSCQGSGEGGEPSLLRGKLGEWVNVRAEPGVSFSVRVDKGDGVGLGEVSMYRYATQSIE